MKSLIAGMQLQPPAAAAVASLSAEDDLGVLDLLLVGPHASARASLALHFALQRSAVCGLPALFLCVQDAVEQSVPLLPHMCDTGDPALELLHIKYVRGHLDLQRLGCCLHMLQPAYSAVVVEDMSGVVKTEDRNTLIRTLALLVDGMRAYRAAHRSRCPLLVTDSSDEPRRPRYIYDRWFPLTLLLSPAPPPPGAGGHSCYCLSVSGSAAAARPPGFGGGGGAANEYPAPDGTASGPGAATAAATGSTGPRFVYWITGTHLVLESVVRPGPGPALGVGGQATPGPWAAAPVVQVKTVPKDVEETPWVPEKKVQSSPEESNVVVVVKAAPRTQSSKAPEETATYGGSTRKLTILHFNDVYNIEPQDREPKGGAARLCAKVKEFRAMGSNPLVLFSGDAYNPSLMSTITLGKQMPPVLNEIGVNVSCVGNHDFDYGLENMMKLNAQCKFPWLMANVIERGQEIPYGGAGTTWMQDWNGIKVGVVGLVEEEWLETLGAVNVADMQYKDFIEVGRAAARDLKAKGAEVLIALTHMREPNDRKLAAEVPEFHLILGGHDHHYVSGFIEPHNNLLVKSGTDFRDMSLIEVEFPNGSTTDPKMSVERLVIDGSVPEDPATKAIVDEYMKLMGEKMDEDIGETLEPLDGRFQTVRNRESNLGNFVADAWRKAAGAEIAILNSGSLRSDMIHPPGIIKAKDFVAILPMVDTTVVMECTGAQVIKALENGVSMWPKLEGRFPQVSGLKFSFDPSKPPGSRVVPGSVYIWEFESEPVPMDLDHKYKVAVKEYLAKGKDGYDVFTECKMLVDEEAGVVIPSTVKNHFIQLRVLNKWDGQKIYLRSLTNRWLKKTKSSKSLNNLAALDTGGSNVDSTTLTQRAQARTHGLAVPHPDGGHYCIAPRVEGRIVNVLEAV
ncbi:hypothetical protein HYH02_006961 [Chlamydomonas schloesseri]|uniref:5'-nucleotidase n=1 Tax=Chlamydomonas schloesseri TaxID=2026947 RepID=A0A835WIP4_9CHLO|nr:hypothetical protein HYH02_006961 [Chlamydomonas schloesseri]|eukprot:KAG2448379.1 hypothetical protein HYH02_006961 [Chlamydomonas schloesseri]